MGSVVLELITDGLISSCVIENSLPDSTGVEPAKSLPFTILICIPPGVLLDSGIFISGVFSTIFGTGYIGSEICRVCHKNRAKVIFTYLKNEDKASALKNELEGSIALKIDLRDVAAIKNAIDKLYSDDIEIDILVNNAAVSQVLPLAMVEEEDLDMILDINVKGMFFLTKNAVKSMIRKNKGVIINIGSIAGQRLLEVPVTYAMTKSSVSGFTLSLASELKKFNVRVNSVIPGLIEGGVSNGVPQTLKEDFLKHCALGRAGTAEEVADTVCFLASEKAGYINGQNISVNGGI